MFDLALGPVGVALSTWLTGGTRGTRLLRPLLTKVHEYREGPDT